MTTPWDRLEAAAAALDAAPPDRLADPAWLATAVAAAGLFWDRRAIYGRWEHRTAPPGEPGLWQHPEEFARFLVRAAARRPRRVLELGTFHGFSGVLMGAYLRRFDPALELVSADPVRWLPDPLPAVFRRITYRPGTDAGAYAAEAVDLVFIDADHSYAAVAADYERTRHCPAVALHDVNDAYIRDADPAGGVWRLWREVRGTRPAEEFLRDDGQAWMGIGLLT